MKFTLVFDSIESVDLSYGLVFIPSPVWVQGDREIINLNPENPQYKPGSLRKLFNLEPGIESHLQKRSCVMIIHSTGYGSQPDFHLLILDLAAEGFTVEVVRRD